MLESDLKELIGAHRSEGMIEEANLLKKINDEIFSFNVFTLKINRVKESKHDIRYWNARIIRIARTEPKLYKEIREYNLIFRFLNKLKIKDGYIKKSEMPDFILERNGKKYGIEVTRIYAGNDWVAEKIRNDILAYRLKDKKLQEYINSKKFEGKIKTYNTRKGIVVKAIKEKSFYKEEIVQIKNKIFEKIRKLIDDYNKYDYNYIYAEVVFTDYKELEHIEMLNKEIFFLISHLDVIWSDAEYHLILKIGNRWFDFDLKSGNYTRRYSINRLGLKTYI